jgi:hypothetical protein
MRVVGMRAWPGGVPPLEKKAWRGVQRYRKMFAGSKIFFVGEYPLRKFLTRPLVEDTRVMSRFIFKIISFQCLACSLSDSRNCFSIFLLSMLFM